MVVMISSFSGGAVLKSSSLSGSCTSALVVSVGLFRTSLKCSAHLASCSASVVSSLLCLSTIGVSVAARYLQGLPYHVGSLVFPCHPLHCPVCLVVLVISFSMGN